MQTSTTTTSLLLGLSLVSAVFGQYWAGPMNRPHPIHSRTTQDFNNMLAMASLFGMEIGDLLLMNTLTGGGGGLGFMVPPVRPQQPRRLQRTLSLLGVIDGADIPDPAGAGGKRQGGGQVEEPSGRQAGGKGGNRRRANRRRGGQRRGRGGGAQ